MGKMIGYNNKEIAYDGCPGCAFAAHAFHLDCALANFRNDDKYREIERVTDIVRNGFQQ